MLRVLQISNYMYPHIGGIEEVARDIASALSECQDIEQKIICFNEDASDGAMTDRRHETVHEKVDGVEVIRCGCQTKIASQSLSLSYGKELHALMDDFKPDLVIFHYPNPFVAHFLLEYRKRNFKLYIYWHLDITKQKMLRTFFAPQNRKLLSRADKVIATSPNYVEGSPWLQSVREKCVVIPNSVNTERLEVTDGIEEQAERIRKENQGKTICVAVGRHVEYKGFKYLIEASEYLDESFRVFIIGEGKLTEELKKQAEGNKQIVFTGRLDDDEMKAYLLASDIFCFSSITKNEAFGLALAEAMYYRKPAVTFTIPGSGVNYVCLNGEDGIEVPNRDTKAYAEAIKTLASDKALREKYGENGYRRVCDNFLKKTFNENIKNLVGELLENE